MNEDTLVRRNNFRFYTRRQKLDCIMAETDSRPSVPMMFSFEIKEREREFMKERYFMKEREKQKERERSRKREREAERKREREREKQKETERVSEK